MRFVFFFITAIVSAAFCYLLDTKVLLKIPLGKLLSPQEGIWQNAEPVDQQYSADLHFGNLTGKTEVYFDARLVPHVFAENENDAYFVQGFLHAKFRLWQMELQTLAAAGRLSEVLGEVAINHDREFRRLGMNYAAENALQEMEKDDQTKSACDAYTAGVNAYLTTLTNSSLPLEYKLLGIKPERWTNFKSALFLKYMSYNLSGFENDFEMTNAKSYFNKNDFDKLFPVHQDSVDPVIPKGTAVIEPKVHPVTPAFADSLYFNFIKDSAINMVESEKPNPNNGSNNWAVSGMKTKSGAPILCNDPHLGLNLPSIWFEMQISVPEFNAYGVSFPGTPGIIIGFNDHCAFGFTNSERDVRDYYEIKFKDNSKREYWFDSSWKKTTLRIERIKIAGKSDLMDTVAYTVFGPVMYDHSFNSKKGLNKNYAVCWTAYEKSNEFKTFYLLDRARNYDDYLEAVNYLNTPGQNCVFACKTGDIAIRAAGDFPAKWNGQGDFIMPGTDSGYMWQGMIPKEETPFQYNPERGFVSSANQLPVDTPYPYYLGRNYPLYRARYLNSQLTAMQNITPQNMMALQTNNHDLYAEMAVPVLLKNIQIEKLNSQEKKYFDKLKKWNFDNDAKSVGAIVFDLTWHNLYDTVYNDNYTHAPKNSAMPSESSFLESLLKDSAYKFVDMVSTPWVETLQEMSTSALKKAVTAMEQLENDGNLEWSKYKDTHIDYLLKFPSFSRFHLPIGGGENSINATTSNHGPSWRMIVSLTEKTEAYGIYPGGQSGNPGSKFYDDAIDNWVSGNYYELWLMKKEEEKDKRIMWKMSFSKS